MGHAAADEHEGRGQTIRNAREIGLEAARVRRQPTIGNKDRCTPARTR